MRVHCGVQCSDNRPDVVRAGIRRLDCRIRPRIGSCGGCDESDPVRLVELDPQTDRWGDIWSIFVPGLKAGTLYHFQADGPYDPAHGQWFKGKSLDEALTINGADPDFHRRDLWDAITLANDPPEWELGLQLFDDDFADSFAFDILDPTKIIPEEEVPLRMVGRLVLDRMPDNFFNETEQVAFCTQNVVPGIDFTNDPLLQGRNFSYLDTQLKRLGSPNFTQLPINAPRCPVHNFMQDGHMQHRGPKGRANYDPNSRSPGGPRADAETGYRSFPEEISGPKRRIRPESFADHYSQARQFYRSQTPIEQDHIAGALVFELSRVETESIRLRMLSHLPNIDPDLAARVADGLGVDEPPEPAIPVVDPVDLPPSDALSILKKQKITFRGRKLGILATDGVDDALLDSLVAGVLAEGAIPALIAPRISGIVTAGGMKNPCEVCAIQPVSQCDVARRHPARDGSCPSPPSASDAALARLATWAAHRQTS